MEDLRIFAFADEAGSSIEHQIAAMQRNGLAGLEIRNVDGVNVSDMTAAHAREVRKKLDGQKASRYSLRHLVSPEVEAREDVLARAVAGALKGYVGEYCVESFNPLLLRACRRSLPDAPRGLLVASPETMRRMCGIAAGWALSNLLLAPLARPQFVAYEEGGRVSRGLAVWRGRGGACAVWTVRTAAGMERAHAAGELAIFEGAEALEAALRLRDGRG